MLNDTMDYVKRWRIAEGASGEVSGWGQKPPPSMIFWGYFPRVYGRGQDRCDRSAYVWLYVRTYIRTYVRTNVRMYERADVRTYVRMYVHTYIREMKQHET